MKIKKGNLYFYNNGGGCYIVEATGVVDTINDTFEGVVVYLKGNSLIETTLGGKYDDFDPSQFVRLSNKITTEE